MEPTDIQAVADPGKLEIATQLARAEYIFVWHMDSDRDLPARLAPHYALLGGRPDAGTVFRRATDYGEQILLPLVGSTIDRGAPAGMSWRVEQSVRNSGPTPVTLLLFISGGQTASFDLAPGASAPIAANAPYAFASLPRNDAESVQFTTVLRRVDAAGNGASVSVPAVRARDFRAGSLAIQSVPFADPYRVALRVWTQGARPQSVLVTLRDTAGRALAFRQLPINDRGAGALSDLVHDFGDVPQRRQPVTITVEAPGAKLWAFASAVDPNVAAPAFHFPR